MKSLFIKKYIVALFAVLVLAACDKRLDIEPAQSISENVALTSDSNVKVVLNGAYDALANGDLFGGNTLRNAELLGGDGEILWVGTFNAPGEIFRKEMIATNNDITEVWLEAYEAINVANNVLSALDVVNEGDRNQVEAEARFIRGLLYFELVRFYAQQYEAGQTNSQPGVPIILTPTRSTGDENQIARNTVEECYAQIIEDLSTAEERLGTSISNERATSGAAAGLLARVYLQMGDYTNARDAADRVIGSGVYDLLANYADNFNNNADNSESIFAAQVNAQDGINNMNTFFSIPDFGGRDGDVDILQDHLDLYDPADVRLTLFYDGNGATRSGKWNDNFGDVGILRLAEMYLIRAECNMRLGTNVGGDPIDDYNAIHTRAGLAAAATITLNDILFERRLELAHEGFQIHDIKRLQGNVASRPYNDEKLVFPIPARELEANPNLVQNPSY